MSKVQTVEAIPVSYPEPNDYNALRHLCLVKITTDDGVVGWGESITQFPEANFATKAIIEGMAERVVGKDPLANIAIWYRSATRCGGTATGRHRQLRGRRHRHRAVGHQGQDPSARACSTCWVARSTSACRSWPRATPTTRTSAGWSRRPRSGSHPVSRPSRSASASAATRAWATSTTATSSTSGGCARGWARTSSIMIDCGWNVKWDVSTAIRRVQAFEEHGLHWIEEPLARLGLRGLPGTCADKTTTLIAYGEKEWDVAGFERLLDTGTVDVVGVDPGRADGITGFKKREPSG